MPDEFPVTGEIAFSSDQDMVVSAGARSAPPLRDSPGPAEECVAQSAPPQRLRAEPTRRPLDKRSREREGCLTA